MTYGFPNRILPGLAFLAGLTIASLAPMAHAETVPDPGLLDARIRISPYSSDQVYRLRGYVGYQIDLEFEPGEIFVGLAAGDIEGLSFVAESNHLFLKPKVAKVGTNLTIVTSRRTYQVDYSASTEHPDATQEVIYALRFTYAQEPVARSERAAAEKAVEPRQARNFDYWYCGNPALKPIAASDDGVHTRLRFAVHAEQPAIFLLNEEGTESLLNFNMEDGDVILHRVAKRLIVRRGALAGCIVNKSFVGGGERLKSNTTTERVERETKGPGL